MPDHAANGRCLGERTHTDDDGGDSVFRTPPTAGYCLNGRRDDLPSGSISVEVGGRQILPPPTSMVMG
uniref:Uncharacterized protein n=1 Tax=Oryza glumipatula TaxID=40148 RepID=A0A0E0BNQ2_9ORYZ